MPRLVFLLALLLVALRLHAAPAAFKPYIESARRRRRPTIAAAIIPVMTTPRQPHAKLPSISEEQARRLILPHPNATSAELKHHKASLINGHTFIPSVNVKKPSHPVPKSEAKKAKKESPPKAKAKGPPQKYWIILFVFIVVSWALVIAMRRAALQNLGMSLRTKAHTTLRGRTRRRSHSRGMSM